MTGPSEGAHANFKLWKKHQSQAKASEDNASLSSHLEATAGPGDASRPSVSGGSDALTTWLYCSDCGRTAWDERATPDTPCPYCEGKLVEPRPEDFTVEPTGDLDGGRVVYETVNLCTHTAQNQAFSNYDYLIEAAKAFKWNGTEALLIENLIDALGRQADLIDKYKWQVRDTCARAERAEAALAKAEGREP